jgi:hypothetical protein
VKPSLTGSPTSTEHWDQSYIQRLVCTPLDLSPSNPLPAYCPDLQAGPVFQNLSLHMDFFLVGPGCTSRWPIQTSPETTPYSVPAFSLAWVQVSPLSCHFSSTGHYYSSSTSLLLDFGTL